MVAKKIMNFLKEKEQSNQIETILQRSRTDLNFHVVLIFYLQFIACLSQNKIVLLPSYASIFLINQIFLSLGEGHFVWDFSFVGVKPCLIELILLRIDKHIKVDNFEKLFFQQIKLLQCQTTNASIVWVCVVKIIKIFGSNEQGHTQDFENVFAWNHDMKILRLLWGQKSINES